MAKGTLLLTLVALLLAQQATADGSLFGRIRNALVYPETETNAVEEMIAVGQWGLRLQIVHPQDLNLDTRDWPVPLAQQSPFDAFNLALGWGALSAGAGYFDLRSDGLDGADPWRLNASFRTQRFGLGGQYVQNDPDGGDVFSDWSLLGEYYFGDSTLRAIFSDRQNDDQQQRSWALGLQHAFSERTRIYSEYQGSDVEGSSQIGVGLRYGF